MSSEKPYFFLSYAHTPRRAERQTDNPDHWITKLYDDLSDDIMQMTNLSPEDVGFIDKDMPSGSKWSAEVAEALATCRVFVPLYSPRYFSSEHCGREWAAFARRSLDHSATKDPVDAILPVKWTEIDIDHLPNRISKIQIDDLGTESYWQDGFYAIAKIDSYSKDYKQAVLALAKKIVRIAEHTPLPVTVPPDYDDLSSAFGPPGEFHRPIHITVAALDNSMPLPDGRTGTYYGDTCRDWNPYRPKSSVPISTYAAGLAECIGYEPTVGSLDQHFTEYMAKEKPVAPGLVLVDAWASMDPDRYKLMRDFDQLDRPWIRPLVPWNNDDVELVAAEDRLRLGLTGSLGRSLSAVPSDLRIASAGIPTIKRFGDAATRMALTAGREYLKIAEVGPLPGSRIERPRLDPPGSEDIGEAP